MQLLQPLHMGALGVEFGEINNREGNCFPAAAFLDMATSSEGIVMQLHKRLTTLTSEELRFESPDNVQKLNSSIEKLLLAQLSFYDTSKVIYEFRLAFSLQCFRCPFLDKRLHSMKEFNHLSSQALEVGSLGGRPNSQRHRLSCTHSTLTTSIGQRCESGSMDLQSSLSPLKEALTSNSCT